MSLLNFKQVKDTWHEIAKINDVKTKAPSFELDVYKKLSNRFHPGPYYYYIFNVAETTMEYISAEITDVLGWETESLDVEYFVENIHPDDIERFIRYEQQVTRFFTHLLPEKVMSYKVSYDYRLRCADGSYKWILQQVSTIQCGLDGGVERVFAVHTDITSLKTEDIPVGLSFLGMDGEPSYHNVLLPFMEKMSDKIFLTAREKEVLKLVLNGETSQHIAEFLHISIHTVRTHRKNILKKSECKNLAELTTKAFINKWV